MGAKIKKAGIGVVTGFLNGLFGSGGGTVVVPALEKFLKVETKKAHASAIAIILPLSVVSAVVYIRGGDTDWRAALNVSIGGAAGGFLGAKLLNRLSSGRIHKIFGVFMIAAALKMIF